MVWHGVLVYPKSNIFFYDDGFRFGRLISLDFLFIYLFEILAILNIMCISLMVFVPHIRS
jgi:hypothetical protein